VLSRNRQTGTGGFSTERFDLNMSFMIELIFPENVLNLLRGDKCHEIPA
jgi:hypothetical protein